MAVYIPALAVSFRRFHDIGQSGAYIFSGVFPIIGSFIVLFFLVQPTQNSDNQYGPVGNYTPSPIRFSWKRLYPHIIVINYFKNISMFFNITDSCTGVDYFLFLLTHLLFSI
ncbi:MAG: DUF805 domain-containing protein [Halobacteriovoraceae bacterium]|nr:DUF805 domain-containing protein [Halobacteriovoraceae bacterium]